MSSQNRIKLCLIIPTLERGGAEKQLSLLAKGLDPAAFDTTVIVLTRSGPLESELRAAGVHVDVIGKHATGDPIAWYKLYSKLKKLKPDVVHTWLFAANAYGRSAAKAAGVRAVVGSERSVDPWKGTWQLSIDRFLAKRTQGISTNSQGVVDFYDSKGVARSNFTVIPNGIPPRDPAKDISREEAFRRLGIPLHHKLILSIGRLWAQKGYKDLIWSAEMLRVLRGDISYVVIGEGPERQRLEEYRDNIRAAREVYLVGHRDDAAQILPHADLLWNGSLYEGQSNVLLEAMQAGVVTLATDIPGNQDLVDNEQTGILFPLGDVDRLMRISHHLLDDSERRHQLSLAAKAKIEQQHTVPAMVQAHEAWYRKLLTQ